MAHAVRLTFQLLTFVRTCSCKHIVFMQIHSCELNVSLKFTLMTQPVMHAIIFITQQLQEGTVRNSFSCFQVATLVRAIYLSRSL